MPYYHKVIRVNNIIPQYRNIRLFINKNVLNENIFYNFHRKNEKQFVLKNKNLSKNKQKAYVAIENR